MVEGSPRFRDVGVSGWVRTLAHQYLAALRRVAINSMF